MVLAFLFLHKTLEAGMMTRLFLEWFHTETSVTFDATEEPNHQQIYLTKLKQEFHVFFNQDERDILLYFIQTLFLHKILFPFWYFIVRFAQMNEIQQ